MTNMRLVREKGNERTYHDDETGHIVKMYTTPEGFELPKPLLLPDARSFGDVLEYLGEWDHETMSHLSGKVPRPDLVPAPRRIFIHEEISTSKKPTAASQRGNEIGPLATVDLSQLGGKSHRSIAVRATDAVLNAVKPRIVTPDDHLSFRLIAHKGTERVLVILEHGYIIGNHWLAYIDPVTIPPYPYEARDARYKQICDAIKENDETPFVKRLPGGDIEISAFTRRGLEDGPKRIVATVHTDGSITRVWTDGTTSVEPASGGLP